MLQSLKSCLRSCASWRSANLVLGGTFAGAVAASWGKSMDDCNNLPVGGQWFHQSQASISPKNAHAISPLTNGFMTHSQLKHNWNKRPPIVKDPILDVVVPTFGVVLFSSILIPGFTRFPRSSVAAPLFMALASGSMGLFRSLPVASEAATTQRKFYPTYGCPLIPQDILYQPVQQALQQLRNKSKKKLKSESISQQVLQELQSSGDESKATLTLTGFKGGNVEDQVNQDRSFVISSFLGNEKDAMASPSDDLSARRLMGVFDGHATFGEHVSEYCSTELPKLLASRLSERLTDELTDKEHDDIVVAALHETFLELDQTAPHGESGGCTASVMLQLGKKLYFANTGDSPTFLCVHHSSSRMTQVVYLTREDKPSLPDERTRVEAMGGKVWVPLGGGSSRVLFTDPVTGDQTGIAMSRSIGDRDVGKYGVIPDPTIDVVDLEVLIQQRMQKVKEESGGIMGMIFKGSRDEELVDDVHIFAVSASDGMMDILNPLGIARFLVPSLCQENGEHLLTACEKLISTAADGWQRACADKNYRDDIAISVCKIRTPPHAA